MGRPQALREVSDNPDGGLEDVGVLVAVGRQLLLFRSVPFRVGYIPPRARCRWVDWRRGWGLVRGQGKERGGEGIWSTNGRVGGS